MKIETDNRKSVAIDFRDFTIFDIAHLIDLVWEYKQSLPNLKAVVISPSQRNQLAHTHPQLYADLLLMAEMFEKPTDELDFRMVINGCRVEVE